MVKGGEAWVCIEPLSHTMSAHTRGVKRKGKPPHSSKGEAPGPDPGPDLDPDLCGEARGVSPHPMGAIWTERGWVSRRVGELSRTMRAQLMARGTMEGRVLESGVWQLDLQAPRIPATKRAGFASTEAYLRGFEGKGIWSLSGLEVAFRIQGRVPTLAKPWHLQALSRVARVTAFGHSWSAHRCLCAHGYLRLMLTRFLSTCRKQGSSKGDVES